MKTIIIIILLIAISIEVFSQQDSLPIRDSTCLRHKFKYQQLIAPVGLIGLGVIGMTTKWGQRINHNIRDKFVDINGGTKVDNYLQYSQMVAVYGLNLCGVKGAHNFRDRTVILATSYLIMGAAVNGIKYSVKERRPDGSSRNSFPSGHTATAFMGAEFLYQEYKDVSPWIGVAGYTIAAGTGVLRMYNNRHWLTDVLAGAGIGILSTKAAYWIYPHLEKVLFKKKHSDRSITAAPFFTSESAGLSGMVIF